MVGIQFRQEHFFADLGCQRVREEEVDSRLLDAALRRLLLPEGIFEDAPALLHECLDILLAADRTMKHVITHQIHRGEKFPAAVQCLEDHLRVVRLIHGDDNHAEVFQECL